MDNSKGCPVQIKIILSMVKTTINTNSGGYTAK